MGGRPNSRRCLWKRVPRRPGPVASLLMCGRWMISFQSVCGWSMAVRDPRWGAGGSHQPSEKALNGDFMRVLAQTAASF